MRQLNIHNLQVSIDARGTDSTAEAYQVIAALNLAIEKVDGSPILLFESVVNADYEESDDGDDDDAT